MALMTARYATGRDKVVVFDHGYHGGPLYFGDAGAPLRIPFDYVVLPYNDSPPPTAAFERHGAEIACVLVEPMQGSGGCIPGDPEFLAVLAGADDGGRRGADLRRGDDVTAGGRRRPAAARHHART